MKKMIVAIGLAIGLSFTLLAQDITLSKSDLAAVLCTQWEIEYASMNGMKIGQMPGAADFDFKFKSDGNYDLIREEGTNESGMWTYDTKNKYVELSIEGKVTSRIKSIDKNKLILTLAAGENDPPGLPSLEVHFKPV